MSIFDAIPSLNKPWVNSFFALQIPKTASTSISKCVSDRNLIQRHHQLFIDRFGKHPLYRGVFDTRHAIPEHIAAIFPGKTHEFFSFVVVRDPIERIKSSYSFGRDSKMAQVYGLSDSTTIDEYIEFLWKNRTRKDILILLPQITWVKSPYFNPHILRFEMLSQDWKEMIDTFGIKYLPPLPHTNKSENKVQPSQESVKKILDLYQNDYYYLGYDQTT